MMLSLVVVLFVYYVIIFDKMNIVLLVIGEKIG